LEAGVGSPRLSETSSLEKRERSDPYPRAYKLKYDQYETERVQHAQGLVDHDRVVVTAFSAAAKKEKDNLTKAIAYVSLGQLSWRTLISPQANWAPKRCTCDFLGPI
jgi:hypothetical protein